MDIITEMVAIVLSEAARDAADRMERECAASCVVSDDPVYAQVDAYILLSGQLRQEVVENHVAYCDGVGCRLCEEEFGVVEVLPPEPRMFGVVVLAVPCNNTLVDPPRGSWAETARIMAEIFPDEDWDSWKDEMKEGAHSF